MIRAAWPVGIMQGRLSPASGGRIQAFPFATWEAEFERAARLGFASIEWIVDVPVEANPLWTHDGRRAIRASSRRFGVRVSRVCADCFMDRPLAGAAAAAPSASRALLGELIARAADLGLEAIVIPCVDGAEIRDAAEEDDLTRALSPLLDAASSHGVGLALEMSLPPERVRRLLERMAHPALSVTYDSGNSASLGYDVDEEFDAYGGWVSGVHVKDRMLGGGTVPLGAGRADIPQMLRRLRRAGYQGDLVLQAARGADDCVAACESRARLDGWLAALDGRAA